MGSKTYNETGIIVADMVREKNDYSHIVYAGAKCFPISRKIFNFTPDPKLSRSENEKRMRKESFYALGEEVIITISRLTETVVKMEKLQQQRAIRVVDGVFMVSDLVVLSEEANPRCWTDYFGLIDVGKDAIEMAVPNVVYNGWIAVSVEKDSLSCTLHSVSEVVIDETARDRLSSAPWLEHCVISRYAIEEEEEFDYAPRTSRPRSPEITTKIISSRGILLNAKKKTIFCPQYPDNCVYAASFYRSTTELLDGTLLSFKMFYCNFKKGFVAFNARKMDSPDTWVPAWSMEEDNRETIYYTLHAKRHERYDKFFYAPQLDDVLIGDPHRIVPSKDQSQNVQVRFTGYDRVIKFEIASTESSRQDVPPKKLVEGTALVADTDGNCFCNDLPLNMRHTLGVHYIGQFMPGVWIRYQAALNGERYIILGAKLVHPNTLAPLTSLYVDGQTLLRVRASAITETAVYNEEVGLIADANKLYHAKRKNPHAWIAFNSGPDRETYFFLCTMENAFDKVSSDGTQSFESLLAEARKKVQSQKLQLDEEAHRIVVQLAKRVAEFKVLQDVKIQKRLAEALCSP
jgi:hypothetical protein